MTKTWDEMTPEEQDQAFRDSIPHEEHEADGYYMVGCVTCDAQHAAIDATGACPHCAADAAFLANTPALV